MRPLAFLNLTPHPVTFHFSGGEIVTIPPDGPAPRVTLGREPDGMLTTSHGNLPVNLTRVGPGITNLPDQQPGVVLLVSRLVAEALRERTDLVFPDEVVRDDEGRIVAAQSVGRAE